VPTEPPPGERLDARVTPSRREHLHAVLLALVCAVLFLRGALLPGRALVPHPPGLFDVTAEEALADGTFDRAATLRGNVGMADKYLQSLAWDRIMQTRFGAGELPRWTNDIAGGAAFVPQMAQPWQPINALLLLVPSTQWYGWWYLVHQVLFGWFAYAFFRRLGCLHASALLGLVAAVLGIWTQCKVHHNVILTAALSLWPMLSATHELLVVGARGATRRRAVAWLALWTGLSWSTGFVVVALQATYLTLALGGLWTWMAPRGERLRRLLPVGIGLGLGALLSAANMLPVLLASAESARPAFDAAMHRELGLDWDHALGLFWPDVLSQAADRFYVLGEPNGADYVTRMPWSQLVLLHQPLRQDGTAFQHWVESTIAIGLWPMALAAHAFAAARQRALAIVLAVLAALAFGMATADQPFLLLAQLVPGLSAGDLRRLLFFAAMALVVLGTLGVDAQLRSGRRAASIAVAGGVAIVSLVVLVLLLQHHDADSFVRWVAALIAADDSHPAVQGRSADVVAAWMQQGAAPGEAMHNHALLTSTMLRALVVAGLGIGALWLLPRWRIGVWITLTIVELLHAGDVLPPHDPSQNGLTPCTPVLTVPADDVARLPRVLAPIARADAAAKATNGDRPRLGKLVAATAPAVAAMPGNLPAFFGLEDSHAYNPLPPRRYVEFFAALDATTARIGSGVGAFRDPAALRHPLADLFGVRFVLTDVAVEPDDTLVDRTPEGTGRFRLLERTTTLPKATFVHEVDVLPDATARLAELARRDRDVPHRVVLERTDAPRPDPAPATPATVRLTHRSDERVVVQVTTTAAGYLRLADPYDAGWRATVDGGSTELFVADHYLRAVFVPAGEHVVEFCYDGARVVWPLRITLLVYGVLLSLWWAGRRAGRPSSQHPAAT
jgi:hypothetical protein